MAADGCVVFKTESCTVCVLDAATGRTRWERWLGDPLLAQPAVGGGAVFMAWPAKGGHRLGAFDLHAGWPRWEAELATARRLLERYSAARNRMTGGFLVAAGIGLALARK